MKTAELTAVMVANEINLNELACHFGINKKFKWEDTLYLDSQHLKGILNDGKSKKVFIFPFGSMVFMNMEIHEIMDVLKYLKTLDKNILTKPVFNIFEKYSIQVSNGGIYLVENETITIPEDKHFYYEIVSTVLAKSVALEKIEFDIDELFDKIEGIIERLNKGRLNVKDQELSTLFANIFTFKYNTISYIMLLDKPDIVWYNEDAEKAFSDLILLFELDERYEKVRNKAETLTDITEMFTSLAHAKRGTRLEWIIIILIFIEILLSLLFEFLHSL